MSNESPAQSLMYDFFYLTDEMQGILALDGEFKYFSSCWEKVLGWNNEDFKQRKIINFVHEDDVKSTIVKIEKLTQKNSKLDHIKFINRFNCKNGFKTH